MFDEEGYVKKGYRVTYLVILALIVLTFLSIFRVSHSYDNMKTSMLNDTKREAGVLKDYVLSTRKVYQDAFLKNISEFDENSLKLLPAYLSSKISKTFILSNKHGHYIKSVSNDPRNIKNMADEEELKAIVYFNDNPNSKEYFELYEDNENKFYQYAAPLYIEESCLSCHGEKEKAPLVIQRKYDRAFGYKIGDLRGIISIKIPEESALKVLNSSIFNEMIFSFISILMVCIILLVLYRTANKEIVKIDHKVNEYAYTDPLTGLYNRRYLNEHIKSFNNLQIQHRNFAVVFIDIDNFKDVNDIHGHATGDCILKELSHKFKYLTRQSDTLCRYGGEEFIIIINDILRDSALQKVELIRKDIQNTTFDCKQKEITISAGISFGGLYDNLSDIIEEADKALYMAKEDGKNCIKIYN